MAYLLTFSIRACCRFQSLSLASARLSCCFLPLPNPSFSLARKLLLNRQELDRLTGSIERKGYTLVPLSMYWNKGKAKLRLGLAKGKQQHDKRADSKEKDWKRQQARLLKGR